MDRWTDVVLVATPAVAKSDVQKVSHYVRDYASKFSTVIAVNVSKVSGAYTLRSLGVGMATKLTETGQLQTVRSDSDDSPLGMIDTRVLAAAEASLGAVRVVASDPVSVMIQSPAIVRVAGKHVDARARHIVWVEPQSGRVNSAVWLIANLKPAELLGSKVVRLPANFRETRHLHVDKSDFFLGIPGKRSFALAGLPPGKLISANSTIVRLLCSDVRQAELGEITRWLDAAR